MKYFEITFVQYTNNNLPNIVGRKLYKGTEIPSLRKIKELINEDILETNCDSIMLTDIITNIDGINTKTFTKIC